MSYKEEHNKDNYQMEELGSNNETQELCEDCHGSGSLADNTCSSCNGNGVI